MSTPASKGSRGGAVKRVQDYLDTGAFEAELARRVAIRTESQKLPDPAAIAECRRYLDDEMKPAFAAMGFASQVYDNPVEGQGPVLLATRIEAPGLPTVLGYGHGDVVRGLEDQWTKGKGPWVTARDGDRIYGRGTADNKGQHTINMAALRAVMDERGGRLGFNAKFMIEMGEEAGSKGLKELVRRHKADFAADILIASDGPRVSQDRPTLSLGCRGACNFDLEVDLREGGHHSGNWGGLLANPGFILAHALASIVGSKGELLVDELKAPPMSKAVKEALADIEIDGGEEGPQVDEWWGEPDLESGRARLRRQHVQHTRVLVRHAGPAGQRHPAEGRRQLPAALRCRHQGGRHRPRGRAPPPRQGSPPRQGAAAALRQRRHVLGHAHGARPSLGATGEGVAAAVLQRQAGPRALHGRLHLQRHLHRRPGNAHRLDPSLLRLLLPALAGRAHPGAPDAERAGGDGGPLLGSGRGRDAGEIVGNRRVG